MLMSSGTNYGFKRTIPHMLGVSNGFSIMLILVGIGLMQFFKLYSFAHQILQVFSVTYLIYLSFKIATSTAPTEGSKTSSRPMTYLQAALFQWGNPKA